MFDRLFDWVCSVRNVPWGGAASYSSLGPTSDGRIKPDLLTYGTDIVAARGTASTDDRNCETGTETGTSVAERAFFFSFHSGACRRRMPWGLCRSEGAQGCRRRRARRFRRWPLAVGPAVAPRPFTHRRNDPALGPPPSRRPPPPSCASTSCAACTRRAGRRRTSGFPMPSAHADGERRRRVSKAVGAKTASHPRPFRRHPPFPPGSILSPSVLARKKSAENRSALGPTASRRPERC